MDRGHLWSIQVHMLAINVIRTGIKLKSRLKAVDELLITVEFLNMFQIGNSQHINFFFTTVGLQNGKYNFGFASIIFLDWYSLQAIHYVMCHIFIVYYIA